MPFRLGLGCDCCPPPCWYSLCVRVVDRCYQRFGQLWYVNATVTLDGPGGAHHEFTTGGGGYSPAVACLSQPADGNWTITVEADGYKSKSQTVSITECENQTITVALCATEITILVRVFGCVPQEKCGPLMVSLSGPGTITPSTAVDAWDVAAVPIVPLEVPFTVDLSGVDLDDDCAAPTGWTATVTPPSGTGIPATTASTLNGDHCFGAMLNVELEPPDGYVCCGGVARSATLDFSDDWGSCTLTHGAACDLVADWLPGNPLVKANFPWIGSYSFTCDNACLEIPCYGGFGSFSGSAAVTVTIAANCSQIVKLYTACVNCEGKQSLRSLPPVSYGVSSFCRLDGSFASSDCDGTLMASGAWSVPFQQYGCMGAMIENLCVLGNWTLSG